MREMVVLGTGHAGRVIADALDGSDNRLAGFLCAGQPPEGWPYPVLGKLEDALGLSEAGRGFIVAADSLRDREAVVNAFPELCYQAVIHPAAYVAADAVVEPGAYIGAGAIVGAGAFIGAHTVIGEGSIIGALSRIEPFCELLARVNIGREVTVRDHTFIGHSATLKDKITIAAGTVIQTGEIVVKDMVMKMVYKRGAWIYKENGPGRE